jgi:hypothetical protein
MAGRGDALGKAQVRRRNGEVSRCPVRSESGKFVRRDRPSPNVFLTRR